MSNKLLSLCLIGWLVFLSSCSTKEEKQAARESDTPVVWKSFGHDTIAKVPIDSTFNALNLNYQMPDTGNFVYFYHKTSDHLSKVDLNTHEIVFHRRFGSDKAIGEGGLMDATAMVVTDGKVVFFEEEFIHVFDMAGNFIKTQTINTANEPYYILVTQSTFSPTAKDNKIYIHAVPNIPKGCKNRSYYDRAVEGIFDLETFGIDTVPVNYLKEYTENYCGIAFNVDRIVTPDGKRVYAFQSSDSVTVYDPKANASKNVNFASHQKHTFKRFDWEKVKSYTSQDHNDLYVTNPIYYDLGFDGKLGLYYRVYHAQIPLQDTAGNFNTYDRKGKFIVFYDKEFKYFGEAPLKFLGIHFNTENGTVVPYMKNKSLYFLSIHVKD